MVTDTAHRVSSIYVPEEMQERRVLLYRFLLPVMNLIACYVFIKKRLVGSLDTNFFLVDGISINARRVKAFAKTWKALDIVYNFKRGEGPTRLARWFDELWLQIPNAQAPRNRFKLAQQELRHTIRAVACRNGGVVRVLSLASGSAQSVIELMAEMKREGIIVRTLLVDTEPTALRHAQSLAREHDVSSQLVGIEGDVFRVAAWTEEFMFKPDIVEMMGLLDYLPDRSALILFKKIRKVLNEGGYFFVSQVHPNREAFFLKWVVNWDMIYRSAREVQDLLHKSGFPSSTVVTEFHDIQCFAVARVA